MSTRKVMMLYGERLGTFSKRIPESKRAEIEAEWTSLMKKYEKPTIVEILVGEDRLDIMPNGIARGRIFTLEDEKPKAKPIKEPILVVGQLYNTIKVKNIAGYGGCLKDEFSDKHYWNSDNGWVEFDDLQHITDYLTKNKP